MAEHDVKLEAPSLQVLNSDVTLVVRRDGEKLGELALSKGGAEWFPKNTKVRGFHLSWREVADIMQERGHERKH